MSDLDKVIHEPVRLRVMACLDTLKPKEQVDFVYLRDLLEVTDGNLGAHLQKLEEAGYIGVKKRFVGRKPKTFISATTKGRAAFGGHVEALKRIIEGGEAGKED